VARKDGLKREVQEVAPAADTLLDDCSGTV